MRKASREAQRIKQKGIRELCGALKGKLKGDPVELIRKMRDAEWN